MSGGVIDTSVVPDLMNAGSSVINSIGQGAGWLKSEFDKTSPDTQKWILAAVGLFGGAMVGNFAASMSGTQGTWSGTALKWGIALAAMTFLSSEHSPLRTAGVDNAVTPAVAEAHPRDPRTETLAEARPETVLPRRDPMSGPS